MESLPEAQGRVWDEIENVLGAPDKKSWITHMMRREKKTGRGVIVLQVGDISRYDWLRLYSHIQRLLILADRGETQRMTEAERAV